MPHVTLDTTAKVYFWIEAADDETGKLRTCLDEVVKLNKRWNN